MGDATEQAQEGSFPFEPRLASRLQTVRRSVALCVGLIGALALAGRIFHVEWLKSGIPGLSSISPNTATAILIGAICLAIHRVNGMAWVGLSGSLLITLLGAVTLGQYLFGVDLGIDRLLFRDTGRPALFTAIALVCGGASLVLLYADRSWAVQQTLAILTGLLAVVSLNGAIVSVATLYRFGPFVSMAISTSVGMLGLSFCLLTAVPTRGFTALLTSSSASGLLMRRFVPFIFLGPSLIAVVANLGYLLDWHSIEVAYAIHITVTALALFALSYTSATAVRREEQAREKSYDKLRESESRYHTLAEALPAIVFTALPDGFTDYLNQRWYQYTGLSPEQSEGYGWTAVLHADDGERTRTAWKKAVDTGQPYEIEYRFRRHDGAYRWFRGRGIAVRDDGGRILKWLGVCSDIEDEKQSHEQLRQLQKLDAVGRLAGGVAHDFNNLLTVITGYNAMMLGAVQSQPQLLQYAKEIGSAAERGASLTKHLLTFSRRQAAQPKPLIVNEVVQAMAKLLERVIGEDIELITKLAPDLGVVRADPIQLDQIIMNLAVNARDAMPNGGRLLIETANKSISETEAMQRQVPPGEYVVLSASDSGLGMDSETKSHLFEPFFTTKEFGKGTGLGLSIIYGVVKQSDGFITVDSEPKKGTTFTIFLPRCWDAITPGVAASATASSSGSEAILLVEDEEVVRRFVGSILRLKGYRVLEAPTPSVAISLVSEQQQHIDLMLTDVLMPEMRAPELIKRVQAIRPRLPVICMSGYSDNAFLEAGAPANAEYLQKPFTPEELGQRVRKVLDGAK
jgi:PAS domain S-box-containing protein